MNRLGITLDSVSLNSLLRTPKPSRKMTVNDELGIEKLIKLVISGKLFINLDRDGGIEGEWSETCGVENVRQIVIKLIDHHGLEYLTPKTIPSNLMNQLRNMGFTDTGDKLILRVAVASEDKTIVSDDPDFWNPAASSSRGDPNALVCKFCKDNLDVTIILLTMLFLTSDN